MTTEPQLQDRSEVFVRFHRRNLIAVLVITLVLGAVGLALALSPPGAAGDLRNLPLWMLPILIFIFSRLLMMVGGRRIDPRSPEVQAAIQDEWRRTNMFRAARVALIVVLIGQCPLGLAFAFLTQARLDPAHVAGGMAASTIVLGIVTTIILFLYFDRE
jgi:hypothetical protein